MNNTKEQAKDVLCMILLAAGGTLKKKVALYKAFYLAHLYFWQNGEGTLTEYPIVRMPQGPGIDDGTTLIQELENEGRIRVEKEPNGPFEEHTFVLTTDYKTDRNDPRYLAIDSAVDFVKEKSAAELSEITHQFSRSWQETPNGMELNIYLDLLDDKEYDAIQKRLKEAEEMINGVFA